MSDEDQRHDARMAAGQASLAMLDALEHDEINEALNALVGWANTMRDRLTEHDVNPNVATGMIMGAILSGMNRPDPT